MLYKHLSTFICDVCRHKVHCIISEKPTVSSLHLYLINACIYSFVLQLTYQLSKKETGFVV